MRKGTVEWLVAAGVAAAVLIAGLILSNALQPRLTTRYAKKKKKKRGGKKNGAYATYFSAGEGKAGQEIYCGKGKPNKGSKKRRKTVAVNWKVYKKYAGHAIKVRDKDGKDLCPPAGCVIEDHCATCTRGNWIDLFGTDKQAESKDEKGISFEIGDKVKKCDKWHG